MLEVDFEALASWAAPWSAAPLARLPRLRIDLEGPPDLSPLVGTSTDVYETLVDVLRHSARNAPALAVAWSGGVHSSLLLKAAADACDGGVELLAIHVDLASDFGRSCRARLSAILRDLHLEAELMVVPCEPGMHRQTAYRSWPDLDPIPFVREAVRTALPAGDVPVHFGDGGPTVFRGTAHQSRWNLLRRAVLATYLTSDRQVVGFPLRGEAARAADAWRRRELLRVAAQCDSLHLSAAQTSTLLSRSGHWAPTSCPGEYPFLSDALLATILNRQRRSGCRKGRRETTPNVFAVQLGQHVKYLEETYTRAVERHWRTRARGAAGLVARGILHPDWRATVRDTTALRTIVACEEWLTTLESAAGIPVP